MGGRGWGVTGHQTGGHVLAGDESDHLSIWLGAEG